MVSANPLKTESPKIDAGVHSGWFSEGTRESRDVTLTAAGDTPSDSAVGWTLLPWRRPILSWGPGLPGEGRSRCGCGRCGSVGWGRDSAPWAELGGEGGTGRTGVLGGPRDLLAGDTDRCRCSQRRGAAEALSSASRPGLWPGRARHRHVVSPAPRWGSQSPGGLC